MPSVDEHQTLVVLEAGQRLDAYLAEHLQGVSRSALKRLIQGGQVLVNGLVAKPGMRLRAQDVIGINLTAAEPALPQPRAAALDFLYEDDDLIVLNKPVGMVVHPAPGHQDDTLVNALLSARPEIRLADRDPMRPGIVHRLDRDTSGLLLVAKTAVAQNALLGQFSERTVHKLYLCFAHGHLQPDDGAIEAPIGRDPRDRQSMAVVAHGRAARTEYTLLAYHQGISLARVRLITGRTHQIRVHFAAIGHPVIGDALYGGKGGNLRARRQMLHAWRLAFDHPVRGDRLRIEAPVPSDMRDMALRLGMDLGSVLLRSDVWD